MSKQEKLSINRKYDYVTAEFREFIARQEGTYQGHFQKYLCNAMLHYMQQDQIKFQSQKNKKTLIEIENENLKSQFLAYRKNHQKIITKLTRFSLSFDMMKQELKTLDKIKLLEWLEEEVEKILRIR